MSQSGPFDLCERKRLASINGSGEGVRRVVSRAAT
jgi:hypothetical protein